jgi:hypothetical protein
MLEARHLDRGSGRPSAAGRRRRARFQPEDPIEEGKKMKRTSIIMAMVIALALSTMAGAFANGRWDNQVTGGVGVTAGSNQFDLDVSSRQAADGTVKGQIQYTRVGQPAADLIAHVAVDCFYVGGSGYAMSGPAKIQDGTFGDYVSVEIRHDGNAVRFRSVDTGSADCGYSGTYPGSVTSGSFNIK